MKTTRRVSVSASYVWERYKNISFLYYCDVIEMIVRTQKNNNNKIEQEQEVNSFFRLWVKGLVLGAASPFSFLF